jgi:hypothetical protein
MTVAVAIAIDVTYNIVKFIYEYKKLPEPEEERSELEK